MAAERAGNSPAAGPPPRAVTHARPRRPASPRTALTQRSTISHLHARGHWARVDSNHRRHTPTGLQPVSFGHSDTRPAGKLPIEPPHYIGVNAVRKGFGHGLDGLNRAKRAYARMVADAGGIAAIKESRAGQQ